MHPVSFAGLTAVLGAPRGWDAAQHGECAGLPVYRGDGWFASYWRPTWRDCFRLLFGGHIQLSVMGSAHPPVMLAVAALPEG